MHIFSNRAAFFTIVWTTARLFQHLITKKQKVEIAEIRKDYTAQIADRDVTMQDKVRKLSDRVPPEEIADAKRLLETQFREEKQSLEEEMEKEIESIRNSKG